MDNTQEPDAKCGSMAISKAVANLKARLRKVTLAVCLPVPGARLRTVARAEKPRVEPKRPQEWLSKQVLRYSRGVRVAAMA